MRCSLIIPACNAERSISSCLESALNQGLSREEYEIVVVDDGSTDNTREIVRNYPVKLIQQQNQGPAMARNRGADEAGGDILIFTDSDCELDYEFLRKIISPVKNDPEIVGVQGSYKTKQKELIAQFGQVEIETRYRRMAKDNYIDFIGTYAAAYRKDIFQKYGGFDTEFPLASGEDAELSYRLSKKGYKMVFNPEAFVYHRHPNTLKAYLRVKFWRAYWRILAYKKNPQKMIKDTYTPQTLKLQIMLVGMIGISICLFPFLGGSPIAFLFLIFVMSSLPFIIIAFKKNTILGFLSAALLFVRACTFLLGNLSGFVNEVCLKELKTWYKQQV